MPELRSSDDLAVMDNLSSHRGPQIRAMIEAIRASLLYFLPDSPDLNPTAIENAFARLKARLSKAAERTVEEFRMVIGRLIAP